MAEGSNKENMFLRKAKAVFTMKYLRYALLGIISALTVLSLVMVIVGNIAYYHYYHYANLYTKAEMSRYVTSSILSIAIGTVLFLVSGFGVYGSLKKSTCVVNTYGGFLSLLFKLLLMGLGLAYSFDRGATWVDFSIPVWGIADADIRREVDLIQNSLRCCGNIYFTDYTDVEFPSDMATVKVSVDQKIMMMPASCCVNSATDGGYCADIWQSGCKYKMLDNMSNNVTMMGVSFACALVITLLGIIVAFLLARSIRKMKSETALLSWRIQEDTIMGRVSADTSPELVTDQPQLETGHSKIKQIEADYSQIGTDFSQIELGSNQPVSFTNIEKDSISENCGTEPRKPQAVFIKFGDPLGDRSSEV